MKVDLLNLLLMASDIKVQLTILIYNLELCKVHSNFKSTVLNFDQLQVQAAQY